MSLFYLLMFYVLFDNTKVLNIIRCSKFNTLNITEDIVKECFFVYVRKEGAALPGNSFSRV